MQLPKKSTKLRKLIDAMPKDKKVSKAQVSELMASVGYKADQVDQTLAYLQKIGYFLRAGSHYGLTDGVLKNYRPQEKVPVVVVDTFKPLSQKYIDAMTRARRLDDGREQTRFISMATNWN